VTELTTATIRVNARAWMRALARDAVQTRCALRFARTPEIARLLRHQLANVTFSWRLLRRERITLRQRE
jgi:hypothetical protein